MKDISYIINHLGEDREKYFNAITPPVFQTSNFAFRDVEELRKSIAMVCGSADLYKIEGHIKHGREVLSSLQYILVSLLIVPVKNELLVL